MHLISSRFHRKSCGNPSDSASILPCCGTKPPTTVNWGATALGGGQEIIEIADRFHLLKNMVEMLQRFFERSSSELILAAKPNNPETGATQLTSKYENGVISDATTHDRAKGPSDEK